jgi:hypothetical protein
MEEVEKFVSFMASYELKTCLDEVYEISGVNHDCDFEIIIAYDFSDNAYVVDYNKRGMAAQESREKMMKS